MMPGQKIVADAYEAFDRWCNEHDAEGEMDIYERVNAYTKWCSERAALKTAEGKK